jgi:hypothetical protein
VLNRKDAFEYLANSREPWQGIELAGDDDESGPLGELVEKLDATVFGLVEALDADRADLPRLLDEALQGSLWARQIVRQERGEELKEWHKMILQARATLIWSATTAAVRRGHFAMGVGLEAGLLLDTMADELAALIDQADGAAISGNEAQLVGSVIALAERLLVLRPFVPDAKNALPSNWRDLLRMWVTGVDVNTIGKSNMGVVEEAFIYRLVWALEALRTRRVTMGWSPDIVAGGGAAALETGLPQLTMAMLVRFGLPSRRAAMVAIKEGNAAFIDGAGMRAWLESNEIAALTDAGDWPTPETAALWQRFRNEMLSGGVEIFEVGEVQRALAAGQPRPADDTYRVEVNRSTGDAWVCTPDYQRVAKLRRRLKDRRRGLLSARFVPGNQRAIVKRYGRGRAAWVEPED